MKTKTLISILLTCILWSCKLDKTTIEIEEDNEEIERIIKPAGKYLTEFENEVCKLQIDGAKTDVANGKLVYEDNKS